MKLGKLLSICAGIMATCLPCRAIPGDYPPSAAVRGITLLSDDTERDMAAIEAAAGYGLNHLELSHRIIHDLKSIRDTRVRGQVNTLAEAAHSLGIGEVCLWDHCLYDTDYYPDQYKAPGTGLLNLDDEGLWEWIKQDYREMFELCPGVDGLVLTFIESGARVEWQVSRMGPRERVAKVIETVASVVCDELGKSLWLRTFGYTAKDYDHIVEGFDLLTWRPGMGLMVKETPHDFFAFHPDDGFVGRLGHRTIVEFDACGEYNGQGVILGSRVEDFRRRWQRYMDMPDVVGFTARTDRMAQSQIIGTPNEINLYTLIRCCNTPGVSSGRIYRDFINETYGPGLVKGLRPVLEAGRAAVDGAMYMLGLSSTHHSILDFEDQSTYMRHVPARWNGQTTVRPGHGVDKELRWWQDIVNTLAPPQLKDPRSRQASEIPEVFEAGWLSQDEGMTPEFLRYIDKWTADCLKTVRRGSRSLDRCRRRLTREQYGQWRDLMDRTLMCMELRREAAICYWGGRLWDRDGGTWRTRRLGKQLSRADKRLAEMIERYRRYVAAYPAAAWDWKSDADKAEEYRWTGAER